MDIPGSKKQSKSQSKNSSKVTVQNKHSRNDSIKQQFSQAIVHPGKQVVSLGHKVHLQNNWIVVRFAAQVWIVGDVC